MRQPAEHPTPTLREDRVTLAQLSALARTFDQISREDRRTWPATDFVRWLRDEWRASAEPERRAEGMDEAA